MLTCDQYLMPESLLEALKAWSRAPSGSRILAGATDVLPWAREGRAGDVHVPEIIDLSRVTELQGYRVENGRVRLGAMLPYQSFLTDGTLRAHLPSMPYCAVWFADDQIREQATLAGNIVNASPAADGTPPVIAMNGTVELARLDGETVALREMPVTDFVTGPGTTRLEPGEIVTAVICDSLKGYGGSFEKVGQRRSLVISVACVTALVKPSADGSGFDDVRLAAGGIGPVPVRLGDIENFLRGKSLDLPTITEASRMTDGLIASRTRREYRREVLSGFIARALEDAAADGGVALTSDRKEAALA